MDQAPVALHTTRPIKAGEELTFDYAACTSSKRMAGGDDISGSFP